MLAQCGKFSVDGRFYLGSPVEAMEWMDKVLEKECRKTRGSDE